MDGACLDRAGDDTDDANHLDGTLPAKPIEQPEDCPASDAACACVKAVAGAENTAAIAAGSDEVEVSVERGEADDRAYDSRVEAIGKRTQCYKERNGKVVPICFGPDVTHAEKIVSEQGGLNF